MGRSAIITRKTKETDIHVELNLDGTGISSISTGAPFFDHMLDAFSRHGLFDLTIRCAGDTHIDDHHTVEDVGLCLGKAFLQALGDKRGIRRFGHAHVPFDETLVRAAADLSGRPYLVFRADGMTGQLGAFNIELVEDFFQGFVNTAQCNLHVILEYGRNRHHVVESMFKASARALREASEIDPRNPHVPSTKGSLES
ncbi:MAG: Imidazoleglycerol-phosphate dehydratase [Myxococcota bacterium]|nr:Imidazoleglycerol-phosphate dehydratase [Myxococcota bacterium]